MVVLHEVLVSSFVSTSSPDPLFLASLLDILFDYCAFMAFTCCMQATKGNPDGIVDYRERFGTGIHNYLKERFGMIFFAVNVKRSCQ